MRATRPPAGRAGRRPGRPGGARGAGETRGALLAAAAELFADRGFDGVPVAVIAGKAGVNKAMISYHFGGKRKLYLAIVTATFAEIASRVEGIADSPRPAPELLREVVAALADLVTRRHPHFPAMMLREVVTGGRRLDPAVVAEPLRILAAVQRIVERGVREGAFRPVDPLLTHLTLVGSLLFFFATSRFRERVLAEGPLRVRPPDAAAYLRHLQDLIAHGLAAGSGDPRRMARREGS